MDGIVCHKQTVYLFKIISHHIDDGQNIPGSERSKQLDKNRQKNLQDHYQMSSPSTHIPVPRTHIL